MNNDITLLRLSTPAKLGSHVSTICLAPANLVLPSNARAVTTGWGRTNPNWMAVHRHKPALSQGCLHEVILEKKGFVGMEEEGALYAQALAATLQQVTLPLIPQNKCMQYWGNRITNTMICAGGAGATSCQGDSGGPLVYQTGNGWTLIGIVSWGTSNCNINTPAIYTRVSQFRNWIDTIVARG
ncbi:Chymotrypsin-like protease CTRL-1 [Lonchura striata]|uniref:Chymotrypsin-like protease CTRL-1 n=1 Tax=Lonchura striata TaxID=40157 RepID=A0A218V7I7_9PASE|nr:Chymotrypsin-like protease CTRL-1 [Lonchura striata domestica]